MKTLPFCGLLFIVLITLVTFNGHSQSGFTTVPPPPGSSGWFKFGTQDPDGYMWFGSNGVHRFDGYSYTSYYNDPQDSTTLAYNRIQAIYADRKGIVWVGTNGGGLDRLDPKTGIFTHFRNEPDDPRSLSNDFVSIILEDSVGKIWVGTEGGGLNRLDPETGIFTHFRHDTNDPTSLSNDEVRALYEDREGTLWIGTGFPRTHDEISKGGGLNRYNPSENNFTRYVHDPNDPTSLLDNRIWTIYEDSKGTFWIGTAGDGLHSMDRKKGSFKRHLYNATDPNALSRPPIRNAQTWVEDIIIFVNEDTNGNLWIGTFFGGINRYDPKRGQMTHYASLMGNSTDKNKITQLTWGAASRDGVLWVAGAEGLFRIDPEHQIIPHYDIGTPVTSIFQEGNGKLWLGTLDGLVVVDSSGNTKKWYTRDLSDTTSLSNNMIFSIVQDSDYNLWIGTDIGLNRFDPKSQKFKRYFPRPTNNITIYEPRNRIYSINENKDGSFWLGTSSTLSLMNRKRGSYTHYGLTQSEPDSLYYDTFIKEDKAGYLWIGSSVGLKRFEKTTRTFISYLSGLDIPSIFESTDAVLWVGTNRGLYYFDPPKDSFEPFTDQGAGLTGNISVFHIQEDDQQSLWVNTSMGLFRLGKNRKDVRFYGKEHGLIPSLVGRQYGSFKGLDGELYFADRLGNGYYAFYPQQLKGNGTAPQLLITEFRVGDLPVIPGKGSPLNLPVSETDEIKLTYNQNVFSFDFVGIHYSNPEGNQNLFMLENLDNDWRKAGEERTAQYYNIPPGNYIFRVKAASANGVWAEKSIVVIIAPPWWRTWWAYFLYGILLVSAIYATHKFQKAKVLRKERERTKDRELSQAKEIEKAYTYLKATQAQLIQSEKMASLGELTAGIAHEIQNPLNFVNNFSDVSNELIDEMNVEMEKGDLEEAKVLAADIKQNLEKINHHGKRADAIVKGMLQHSRTSSGVKEPTDINALADEYLRLAYHGLRAKDKGFNATMKTEFDTTIGVINVVPQDIGRVILNLITNAFYAVNERSSFANSSEDKKYEPTVWVSTKKDKDQITISVRDNGNGIPEKVINKIFLPFFTTKPTGQGTGLGLSMSYDIVKAHGGELKVETKEGEGSKFIIQLAFV